MFPVLCFIIYFDHFLLNLFILLKDVISSQLPIICIVLRKTISFLFSGQCFMHSVTDWLKQNKIFLWSTWLYDV